MSTTMNHWCEFELMHIVTAGGEMHHFSKGLKLNWFVIYGVGECVVLPRFFFISMFQCAGRMIAKTNLITAVCIVSMGTG